MVICTLASSYGVLTCCEYNCDKITCQDVERALMREIYDIVSADLLECKERPTLEFEEIRRLSRFVA